MNMLMPSAGGMVRPPNMFELGYAGAQAQWGDRYVTRNFSDLKQGEALEAMSVGSFTNWLTYLVRVVYDARRVGEASPNLGLLAKKENAIDFRDEEHRRLGYLGQLLQIVPGAEYKDTPLTQIVAARVGLKTWGRIFTIPRAAFINNDINAFRDVPAEWGRLTAILEVQRALVASFANNPLMFDGTNMFDASRGNLGTTALTRDLAGANALVAAYVAARNTMRGDDGNKLPIKPKYLLVPTELEEIANYLVSADTINNGSNVLVANPARSLPLTVVSEPYLPSARNWYLMPDPAQFPIIVRRYLLGDEDPTIININGGGTLYGSNAPDPFAIKNDDLGWKVRFDYEAYAIDWRGTFGAIVP